MLSTEGRKNPGEDVPSSRSESQLYLCGIQLWLALDSPCGYSLDEIALH